VGAQHAAASKGHEEGHSRRHRRQHKRQIGNRFDEPLAWKMSTGQDIRQRGTRDHRHQERRCGREQSYPQRLTHHWFRHTGPEGWVGRGTPDECHQRDNDKHDQHRRRH
jgi:hypothetical protein